ncbi:unnamed protein product [Caenorhabditis angaria]|uniref:Strictosidine synthase conserved region domain-containing protein n=1 Tax=Caenorhabditis angaria TaxID=860376 RepID=A0A9P1MXH3_9PELO|nr:unnamed protein product [Caenorhabditis angaria]
MGRLFLFGFIGLFISWGALYYRYSDEKNTQARKYRLDPPPTLENVLAENRLLEKAEHILENQIVGPESFVVEKDAIYATIYDAKVIKIVNGKIVSQVSYSERAKFFRDCGNFEAEDTCGRPLGIRKLSENSQKFVVADAYLGVFVVDFSDEQNPTTSQILDSKKPIEGFAPKFLNDLDVLNEDEIILSDSSTKYPRKQFMPLILEQNPNGRIIHLKISTKTAKVLISGLYFPNGVQLTSDKQSILFSECSMARIKKLDLKSKNVEMFVKNLPGMPDNIRKTERNTYWVGLAAIRHSATPSLIDKLGSVPGIRQFLIDIIPSKFWETILHTFRKSHSIVVEIDENGRIIRSLHDLTGKIVGDVSQVAEFEGYLYFGSFNSPFLAKLKL